MQAGSRQTDDSLAGDVHHPNWPITAANGFQAVLVYTGPMVGTKTLSGTRCSAPELVTYLAQPLVGCFQNCSHTRPSLHRCSQRLCSVRLHLYNKPLSSCVGTCWILPPE